MVGRGEMTDTAWARIEPLLPGGGRRGGRWSDHRKILNGILWRKRTGAPWRDLPKRYGPWKTVYERFRMWAADSTWDRIFTEVLVKKDAVSAVEWTIQCRLDRDARPPARRRCPPDTHEDQKGDGQINAGASDDRPSTEEIGRSRGGLTSKIHLARDGWGRPLSIVLSAGNINDCNQFDEVLSGIRVPGLDRDGLASAPTTCSQARRRSEPRSPTRDHPRHPGTRRPEEQPASQGPRRGRPIGFNPQRYTDRNVVERCFNRLKQWRALATRYTKRGHYYRAEVVIASVMIWLAG